jgi:hypothetical protein
MKPKKIKKKMALKKQTIAALEVDEMRQQHGGIETNPKICSIDTYCITDCTPMSLCYPCF